MQDLLYHNREIQTNKAGLDAGFTDQRRCGE
jgi:hypothetical protein